MNAAPKRLPAFGRELAELRDRDLVPVNDIAICGGWHRARNWSPRVVVPCNESPDDFDFTFVAGLPCIIFADTRAEADGIARAVARYLPRILIGAVRDPPSLVPYVRSDGRKGVL